MTIGAIQELLTQRGAVVAGTDTETRALARTIKHLTEQAPGVTPEKLIAALQSASA